MKRIATIAIAAASLTAASVTVGVFVNRRAAKASREAEERARQAAAAARESALKSRIASLSAACFTGGGQPQKLQHFLDIFAKEIPALSDDKWVDYAVVATKVPKGFSAGSPDWTDHEFVSAIKAIEERFMYAGDTQMQRSMHPDIQDDCERKTWELADALPLASYYDDWIANGRRWPESSPDNHILDMSNMTYGEIERRMHESSQRMIAGYQKPPPQAVVPTSEPSAAPANSDARDEPSSIPGPVIPHRFDSPPRSRQKP